LAAVIPYRLKSPASLALSFAVHLLVLAALLLLLHPTPLPIPDLRVVKVSLVPDIPQPPLAPIAKPAPEVPPPLLATSPGGKDIPAAPAADGMVHASQFYAAKILADPANAEVRDNLPRLAAGEQVNQICNMEALEQLRAWKAELHPDTVVPYAFGDAEIIDGVLQAQGAAFRDGAHWYHLAFRCTVDPVQRVVSQFEFTVGEVIPKAQWEEHFLNGSDEGLD
jgi:hypothetical protein